MSDALLVPPSRYWTFEDLAGLPDDGSRHEIIDGSLLVSPPPTVRHQVVAHHVARVLEDAASSGQRVVPAAGVLVQNGDAATYLVPDVLLVSAAALAADAKVLDPDDVLLAVEVVSPSTVTRDTVTKRTVYARLGIANYWLVDAATPGRVTALTLGSHGAYVEAAVAVGAQELHVVDPLEVRVAPRDLLR